MPIYTNPNAQSWTYTYSTDVSLAEKFHQTLPNYAPTPLIPLDDLARDLCVGKVFVKDESSRFGLPAFKILGASWGTFRAIVAKAGMSLDTATLDDIARYATEQNMTLFTATDGNHGRAVARMAALLTIKAKIFVPHFTDEETRGKIANEGAEVVVVRGDYDVAVSSAYDASQNPDSDSTTGLFIQDTSFQDYEEIPTWIIEGYTTLLREVERQLAEQDYAATVIVTPIGVGSLGHAVVSHSKSVGRRRGIRVLAVEPDSSACLHASLHAGTPQTIETRTTVMDGMNCGTVSPVSWPVLKHGVDASVTVSDRQAHDAVLYLQRQSVKAGPCGAATLAGLRMVAEQSPGALGLNRDSVVVLLSTEGERAYQVPR